ncbi:MAG TPA: 30S ribosomal protein S9 [Candidatus Dependentiae bacterium]|jgi:small subunit ribosomal protein S9|nr:30S ribosomal protein S9 [Candidatus Dependentiae bacterium]
MVIEKVKTKLEEGKSVKKTAKGSKLAHGVGRRKTSIARVWLVRGSGNLLINGKKHTDYFDTELNCKEAAAPIQVIPAASHYDVEANVIGGGMHSQAGAVQLGIARALLSADESTRVLLRQHNMLTVDSRRKERKKYGQKAARRKFQFVKR